MISQISLLTVIISICREYLDLNRNQLILKELVSRRGLPVLDNIPSGLQRTKDILSGIRDPPSKISSILEWVDEMKLNK